MVMRLTRATPGCRLAFIGSPWIARVYVGFLVACFPNMLYPSPITVVQASQWPSPRAIWFNAVNGFRMCRAVLQAPCTDGVRALT
jgi:hypothetical protein